MKKNYKKVAHSLDFRARRVRHWELRKQWKELFSNSSLGYFALKEDEPPISEREVTRGQGQHWKIKLKSFVGAVEMHTLSRESEVAPFLGLATDPQPYTNPLSCISNSFAYKRQLRSLGLMDQGAAPSLVSIPCSLQYVTGLGTRRAFGHEWPICSTIYHIPVATFSAPHSFISAGSFQHSNPLCNS